jgi:Cytosine/adenosine deaminases
MIFMQQALVNAKKAFDIGEVPIGCVIVRDEKIIAQAFNMRNIQNNVLYHAEILAINQACQKLKSWRLENCILYVTVEPCAMCAGAILQSRIPKIVFGCENKKAGCAGSVLNILNEKKFNHQTQIISGIMKDECSKIMSEFFKSLRNHKNQE